MAARRGGIIQNLLAKSAERVRPLYAGPLEYEDEDGTVRSILTLPKYPRRPRNMGHPLNLTPPVAEQFVRAVRNWNTRAAACALSGITQHTLTYATNRARSEPEEGEDEYITQTREYLLAFIRAVEIAEILAERDLLETLAKAGLEGSVTTKTTVEVFRDSSGNQKFEKTKTENTQHPPDTRVAMWLMERTWPERWALRRMAGVEGTIAVTGPDGGPIEATVTVGDMLSVILGAVERIAAQSLPEPAIDVEETEESVLDGEITEQE